MGGIDCDSFSEYWGAMCPRCGRAMFPVGDQRYGVGEPVRCASCFEVFKVSAIVNFKQMPQLEQ